MTRPVDDAVARDRERSAGGLAVAILDRVERLGNRLPDPITLFVIMIGIVMVASWLASLAGVSVVHPDPNRDETITAVNLFGAEQVRRIFVEMPQTFTAFPPLGVVLVVMLGIGVAEGTGLIGAALKLMVASVPPRWMTAAVVLAGVLSSLAVDAGYVVVIPLGAVIFLGAGRHPIAGLAAAFAGVSGGFTSNLFLTAVDPLLGGFTTPAAQFIDPDYEVLPTANWYIMAALVPVFTITGAIVTERIVEPRLGAYRGPVRTEDREAVITPLERRGLAVAGAVTLLALAGVALLVVPEGAVLRAEGELLVQRIGPFLNSMVAVMFITFLLPGIAYGIATGSIRSDRDVAQMLAKTMSDMGTYIVLAFVAAHLVAFFAWSNLGAILAITGADFLRDLGFQGVPLLVAFVLLTVLLDLLIGSASAKWAIMAPVFVPMFMLLGYSPELTQAAYRIGDSVANIITPLLPYFPLVVVFARRYDEEAGVGTVLAAMLPYSVTFAVVSIALLVAWVVAGLPLGPGAPLHYTP